MTTRRPLNLIVLALIFAALSGGCHTEEKAPPPAAAVGPLPDSAFRVEWTAGEVPAEVGAGETFSVDLSVRNAGDRTWPDLRTADPSATGALAVRLSHRWWDETMTHSVGDWVGREELPGPLAPGASAKLRVSVKAPPQPGAYLLQFDLVQELVAWFGDKGAAQLTFPVRVR